MRIIKNHLSWWRIVLIISVATIAIPIASRVSSTAKAIVTERHTDLDWRTAAANEDADAHRNESKVAAGVGVTPPQDDYYDRRREYWDRRVERRLDRREEYLDEQTGDDEEDAKDSKDSKAAKNKDSKDDDDDVDDVDNEVERRREYWRRRLDKDW